MTNEALVERAWQHLRGVCAHEKYDMLKYVERDDVRAAITAALTTGAASGVKT